MVWRASARLATAASSAASRGARPMPSAACQHSSPSETSGTATNTSARGSRNGVAAARGEGVDKADALGEGKVFERGARHRGRPENSSAVWKRSCVAARRSMNAAAWARVVRPVRLMSTTAAVSVSRT